jgi:cell shape-determining protein MreD
MTQLYFKNIIRFIFLVLFQVMILNHINLSGFINPYLYVYFILLLPFITPKWLLLVSAFLIGIAVDFFSNTMGINAAASVMMAFARPFVIKAISTGTEYEIGERPSLKNQDIKWFVYYCLILILIHHFVLFYLEVFRFREFFITFIRVILSTAFTFLLVMLSEYLFYRRQK